MTDLQANTSHAADEPECFGLIWPGKRAAQREIDLPPQTTMKPDHKHSKNWATTQNVFVEGDNLESLKLLRDEYEGGVKMIYIDPPYNTGKDFVYVDNFRETRGSYRQYAPSAANDAELHGRFHATWLSMMYPRLSLAREFLTPDGVIFLSIDDNELENLTLICNEIFGETNHLNTFAWINNPKGRRISNRGAAGTKEYILSYAKNADSVGLFRGSVQRLKALMPSTYKNASYPIQTDEQGPYVCKNELHNTNSAFNESTSPTLVYDLYYSPTSGSVRTEPVSEQHVHEGFVKIAPHPNRNGIHRYHAFRWSPARVLADTQNLAFVETSSGWKVYTKVRDVDGTTLKDVITDIPTTRGVSDIRNLGLDPRLFDHPKPVDLLSVLITAATHKDSIVMDFFAGSGTTAHAVLDANRHDAGTRRYLLIQLPEPTPPHSRARQVGFPTVSALCIARLNALEQLRQKSDKNDHLDTGFRAYDAINSTRSESGEFTAVSQENPSLN